MKFRKLLCFLFLVCTLNAFTQTTFVVNEIPANTPESSTLYLAGNFNDWDYGDEAYELEFDPETEDE